MALVVFTGGARSGKSAAAARLAETCGCDVVVAVAGRPEEDPEMARRVQKHQADRPEHWTTLEIAGVHVPTWLAQVPPDACLVVDCLGTLLAERIFGGVGHDPGPWVPEALERRAEEVADAIVAGVLSRPGQTIIVTNEVGSGVVPSSAAGRLFRDVLGRANARLVQASDAAYLVVCGSCIDLKALPRDVAWPTD
ncbi:MAG: bifunctional adenosylcobinamide kinase/adenosylcobinamide-phosphate guanylyltransferase [Coriobacteriia bacterium]